jgi:ATP-binding cassette, subfamily B, bacterial MsbA
MKELLPYFRLLKPVRTQFIIALVCALIYGISSGFGLPFMAKKIFPLIFSDRGQQVKLFTALKNGDYFAVNGKSEANSDQFFVKSGDQFQSLPTTVQVTPEAFFLVQANGSTEPLRGKVYVQANSNFVEVKGGLYTHDATSQSYLSLKNEIVAPSLWTLMGAVLLMPFIFILRGASSFFNIYFINYCGLSVLEALRLKVFTKLQHLPISFYHRHKSGDLLNRLLGDTSSLQAVISNVASDMVKQPITLLGGIVYLVYESFQQKESVFILLCFVIIALCVFPIRFVGRQLLKRAYLMQSQLGSVAALASENISAYREVRAFNLQDREISRFKQSVQIYFKLQLNVVRYTNGLNPMIEIVTATGLSMAILYASQIGVSLSDILPLIMALYISYDPVKKMGSINNSIKTGLAAIQRLNFILNQEDETPESLTPCEFPTELKSIEFKNLSFAYDQELVLKNLNLTIPKGEVVALVGPSGAGKSTFGSLVPRFYDPIEGDLAINDRNIKEFRKQDLRKSISIVSQDTVLFDDTVANNIRLGQLEASDEQVRFAAEQAQAHDFISDMAEGYDTRIGERGTRLSGGQKQRLAIARAFLKNAPMLILDEATSALDSESEAKIQQALEKLIVGKTVFIIAHRFSTIKLATRILVFHKGEIVGDGSHEDLIESNALYKDLHQRQELR